MGNEKELLIEKMILDLGAEVYKLRHELSELKEFKHHTRLVLKCFKSMLEECGFVDDETFDLTLEVMALNESGSQSDSNEQSKEIIRKIAN